MKMKIPLDQYVCVTQSFAENGGHKGVDFASPIGTPALACETSEVIAHEEPGYGNQVWLRTMTGYWVVYGHLDTVLVLPGQRVTAGEMVGTVGSTGNSTGPHLHFEVRSALAWDNGANCLNPAAFLPAPLPASWDGDGGGQAVPVSLEPIPAGPGRVMASSLNVRRQPGLAGAVVGRLVKGDVVKIHGDPVQVDGRTWRIIECYVCERDADGSVYLV